VTVLRRISNLFSGSKLQREIERELAAHIEMRIEDNIASGMNPQEARRAALIGFGNPTLMKERTTESDAAMYLVSVWTDARYAIRQLRKSPGYALTAILTLALAIGVNSAVFSLVHAILLRELPFDQPSQVFHLENNAGLSFDFGSHEFKVSFDNAARSFHTIDSAAVYSTSGVNVDWGRGVSERVEATEASAHFLDVLGVKPQLGRGFEPEEDIPGNDQVVLISDAFWRGSLAADPGALGRPIRINGFLFTIIGVLPARMDFPAKTALWTPTIFDSHTYLREGGAFFTSTIVRVKAGVTTDQLRGEFRARALHSSGTAKEQPDAEMPILTPIAAELTRSIRSSLLTLSGAVGFVLLIACANIAGLLLVRTAERRAEFALRAALGAARVRLLGQQLVESTLLALCGGALGILCAHAGLRLLYVFRPAALNAFDRPSIDGTVLAFSAGLAILTGLGFGIVPAWLASREDPVSALKAGVWRATPAGTRLRKALVAGEIGLALVLLIGAGLLLRTMANISKVPLGFDTQGILSFSVSLHGEPYISAETTTLQINSFYSGVLDRLRNLPGVAAVAAISIPPLENGHAEMLLPITPDAPKMQPIPAAPRFASSGYFGVMGIPILKGRDFSLQDTRTSSSVVIVSRDLSDRLWPGQDPIGHKLHCLWYCKQPPTVIGVVAPGRRFGPRSDPLAEYFMDYLQRDWPYMTFLLRTQSDPAALTPAVHHAVAAIDPTQPVYEIETMQQKLNDNESLLRFQLFTLSVFAVFSALLACIGLYGVISSTVTQRTREIGLRIALGAQRSAIQASVLRETAALALAGAGIGILASLALARLLAAILFQTSPHDPLTLGAVSGLLIAIALLAGSIPAYRAASIDPMQALRTE